jgi:hypothetical protein
MFTAPSLCTATTFEPQQPTRNTCLQKTAAFVERRKLILWVTFAARNKNPLAGFGADERALRSIAIT